MRTGPPLKSTMSGRAGSWSGDGGILHRHVAVRRQERGQVTRDRRVGGIGQAEFLESGAAAGGRSSRPTRGKSRPRARCGPRPG